jgi:secreted trypsin-like serine protease
MRKLQAFVAVVATMATFGIAAANAVQYGEPDNGRHPWIGLVELYDSNDVPLGRCSGSLISATKFLTAAHCAGGEGQSFGVPASARIWFDDGPIAADPNYSGGSCAVGGPYTGWPCAGNDAAGTPVAHPSWNATFTIPQTSDVGVVRITSASSLPSTYGALAPVGFLDGLAKKRGQQNTSFTLVGYGRQLEKPTQITIRQRMDGTLNLINLGNALTDGWNVQLSDNPGKGNGSGGACFGDSGGPVLYDTGGGHEVIVAVDSFMHNANCKGTSYAYRVDTGYAQSFIDGA